MKVLLDTQAFIWWDGNSRKLSRPALEHCLDLNNTLIFSLASIWEIQIKFLLGKLQLRADLARVIADQQARGLRLLPVTLEHILNLSKLPAPHKDPFDRLLIAQALAEDAAIISADQRFSEYPVHIIW